MPSPGPNRSSVARLAAAWLVALLAGCALGGSDDGGALAPARAVDPSRPAGGDPSAGTSGAGGERPGAGGQPDAGGRPDAAPRDASTRDVATGADAPFEASGPNACGVCDRTWVCNGFAQYWASEADGRCVNQTNRTGLRCNGILDGSTANNVGTWTGSSQGLTLNFQTLGGGAHVITCTP